MSFGSKSVYLEKKLLDAMFGGAGYTFPGTLYFALFTVAPTEGNDAGTEVSGGSYARVAVTSNGTNFSAATQSGVAPASKTNLTTITWPTASATWGTILAFGVYDASSAGNLLYWGSSTNVTITSGIPYAVPPGNLTITET